MANNPNGNNNNDGNGNGNGIPIDDPNENQGEPSPLDMALNNLRELGISNLQPLEFSEEEMKNTTVPDLLKWAKENLDKDAFQDFKVIKFKDRKIEWLKFKIRAVNEARASLLEKLTGVPAQQQQHQPGEDEKKNGENDNGNNNNNKNNKETDWKKQLNEMGQRMDEMQGLFNQLLDVRHGNGGSNKNDNSKDDEKLDDKEKERMNKEIAQMMQKDRVKNGSNVCEHFLPVVLLSN